jgi:hypothetical protein
MLQNDVKDGGGDDDMVQIDSNVIGNLGSGEREWRTGLANGTGERDCMAKHDCEHKVRTVMSTKLE